MPGRLIVKTKAEAENWVRHYAGRTYWLCCAGCVPKFDADPARFALAQPRTGDRCCSTRQRVANSIVARSAQQ